METCRREILQSEGALEKVAVNMKVMMKMMSWRERERRGKGSEREGCKGERKKVGRERGGGSEGGAGGPAEQGREEGLTAPVLKARSPGMQTAALSPARQASLSQGCESSGRPRFRDGIECDPEGRSPEFVLSSGTVWLPMSCFTSPCICFLTYK